MESFTDSEPVHLVATLYPRPGKSQRILQLLLAVSESVRLNEPGTTRYQVHLEPSTGNVVTYESFENKAANQAHCSTNAFENLYKTIEDEDLTLKPVDLVWLRDMGGFTSR